MKEGEPDTLRGGAQLKWSPQSIRADVMMSVAASTPRESRLQIYVYKVWRSHAFDSDSHSRALAIPSMLEVGQHGFARQCAEVDVGARCRDQYQERA